MEEVVSAWKLARCVKLLRSVFLGHLRNIGLLFSSYQKLRMRALQGRFRSQTRNTPRPNKKRKVTLSQDHNAGQSSEGDIEHIPGLSLVANK